MIWFQKSREKWVKFENCNTRFFHTQTIIRRRYNKISGIYVNGIWCDNDDTLQREVGTFFRNLFCTNIPCHPHVFSRLATTTLDSRAQDILMDNVTKAKVFKALQGMQAYKAPGSDGFQAIFYKRYWDIVGNDVWAMVRQSFVAGAIDPRIVEGFTCFDSQGGGPCAV